jgi:integrase
MALYRRGHSWEYDFWRGGKRYRKTIGPVSQEVAEAVYAQVKATVVESGARERAKMLELQLGLSPRLDDFAFEYLAYYRTNARPTSVRRHEAAYQAVKLAFGQHRLSDITPYLLEHYKRQRLEKGRSQVTVNRELAFLKNLFNIAIVWGRATENPVKKVRFFREDNGRTRRLSDDEEDRLLAACPPHLKPVLIIAIHTGCRLNELLSLTWANVDFQRQRLTIQAGYSKNGASRTIPLNELVLETLQQLKDFQDPGGVVFRNRTGRPYRSCRTAFEAACQRAGIRDFTFHDLRHTFASRLVMAGVHLAVVKELLGHKVLNMTMRYTHLAPEHHQTAVNRLVRGKALQSHPNPERRTELMPGEKTKTAIQSILRGLAELGVVDLAEMKACLSVSAESN